MRGKPRNHNLLATAIVEVGNKFGQYVPCRALLDSASQSHFITERCVQHLRLPRTQTYASIQGISNVNTATYHSVSIHLRSRQTDWHTALDCAILDNITGTTPSTKLDTNSWKPPEDIKLADEHFDQPGHLTYSLELTYFMKPIDQAGEHILAISQFKKQLLAGQFLVELQRSHSVTNLHISAMSFQEGRKTCYFYHLIQSSRKQVPQQELRLHLGELPRLPVALNNTID